MTILIPKVKIRILFFHRLAVALLLKHLKRRKLRVIIIVTSIITEVVRN